MSTTVYPLPAVLDIGNSAIRVLIAGMYEDGSLVVQGVGEAPSAGMEEGRIVDLAKATDALKRAARTAEIEAGEGHKIEKVMATVSGEYIKSYAYEGRTVIGAGDRAAAGGGEERRYQVDGGVVDAGDIHRVREMGVAAVADADVKVLDVIDKTYSLDRQRNIRNPLGMKGRLLAGHVHLIVAERQSLENVEECINGAGMALAGKVMFSGLASAQAALNDEEKRLGVCLLDIGAQTTEMVIFYNGGVYETDIYLEAANLIHADISAVHHTTLASAEKCKRQAGVTIPASADEMLQLVSTSGEDMKVSHSLLLRTVTSRVEALLECLDGALRGFEKKEGRKLTAGVVLTGGGALLPGLTAMINSRLHVPVRVGLPAYGGEKHERVRTPQYAAALGALMMGRDRAGAARRAGLGERLRNFFFSSFHTTKEDKHGH